MIKPNYLCVHGHFYQPPRGNPFVSTPLVEPDAAPYANWNERITAECYRPIAELGLFEKLSFNIGYTLLSWLEDHAPDVYKRILEGDLAHRRLYEDVGNAIAQPMLHTILPLDCRQDKITQVVWGKAAFERRFGRPSEGLWLPEMAVDLETLEVLAEQGIAWTILAASQVVGAEQGAGPYRVRLPGGGYIAIFVRDESLSNDIAFNLGNFGGAGRWARNVLIPYRRQAGQLTLIATDGETFGHHWPDEEQFLRWLLGYEAGAAGYRVITLGRYFHMVEPVGEVEIVENSAWSCGHALGRWSRGCPCTPDDSWWKGGLRRALDNLRHELDDLYLAETARLGVDAHALRNAYIGVILEEVAPQDFIRQQGIEVDDEHALRLLKLVQSQYHRLRMYSSCTFFFAKLDGLGPRYGIANAAYAVQLAEQATGLDLSSNFRHDLSVVVDVNNGLTGVDLYDEVTSGIPNSKSMPGCRRRSDQQELASHLSPEEEN
jgi:hypothetical protein